jgi:hypothetical protein
MSVLVSNVLRKTYSLRLYHSRSMEMLSIRLSPVREETDGSVSERFAESIMKSMARYA